MVGSRSETPTAIRAWPCPIPPMSLCCPPILGDHPRWDPNAVQLPTGFSGDAASVAGFKATLAASPTTGLCPMTHSLPRLISRGPSILRANWPPCCCRQ